MRTPSKHRAAASVLSHPSNISHSHPQPSISSHESEDEEWWSKEDGESTGFYTPSSSGYVIRSGGNSITGNEGLSKKHSVHKPDRERSKRRRQQREHLRAGMRVVTDFSGSGGQPKPKVVPQPQQQPLTQRSMLHPQTVLAPAQRQSVNGPQTSMSLFFNFDKDQDQSTAPPVPKLPSTESQPKHGIREKQGNVSTGNKFATLNDISRKAAGSQRTKGRWWPGGGKSRETERAGDSTHETANPLSNLSPPQKRLDSRGKRVRGLGLAPLKVRKTVSPTDRRVVIGIDSIHSGSPSDQSQKKHPSPPPTPSILITPARQNTGQLDAPRTGEALLRVNTGSSVYSQATTYPNHPALRDVSPPMPADATRKWLDNLQNHPSNRDSDITILEDLSPLTATPREPRSASSLYFMRSRSQRERSHSNDSTMTKASNGWWNTMLSPYLSRSNTATSKKGFSPIDDHPALPNLDLVQEMVQKQDLENKPHKLQKGPALENRSRNLVDWEKLAEHENQHPAHQERDDGLRKELSSVGFAPVESQGRKKSLSKGKRLVGKQGSGSGQDSPDRFSPHDREVPMLFDAVHLPKGDKSVGKTAKSETTRATTKPSSIQTAFTEDNSRSLEPETPTVHQANVGKLVQARSPFPPAGKRADSLKSGTSQGYPSSTLPPYTGKHAPPVITAFSSSHAYPQSPSSVSPGLRRAMAQNRGEPMSEVSLTPGTRSAPSDFEHPSKQWPPVPVAAKKNRSQKKSKVMERWKKAHPKKKRRVYIALAIILLLIIILSVGLGVGLRKKPKQSLVKTQWLNLTSYPPIPTGESTVVQPDVVTENSGCVVPSSMWSCAVPRDAQQSILPNQPNQPNFNFRILYRNSTDASPQPQKRNLLGSFSTLPKIFRRAGSDNSWTSNPAPPTIEDQKFLGSTTDNVTSALKEGQATPFYISFDPTPSTPRKLRRVKRDNDPFPDVTRAFPPPSVNVDGTPTSANLLPLPALQPLRLFDRGLPTEHYGFYSYFDRRIFLSTTLALLNATASQPTPSPIAADVPGGSRLKDSRLVCTWSQTRFLVQIWTRGPALGAGLIVPLNSTSNSKSKSTSPYPGQATADKDKLPGSFPYPISITMDRHGGDINKKMIYCYGVDGAGHVVQSDKIQQLEDRKAFGSLVGGGQGPDGDKVSVANGGLGGIDGGSGGCGCMWRNWRVTTST